MRSARKNFKKWKRENKELIPSNHKEEKMSFQKFDQNEKEECTCERKEEDKRERERNIWRLVKRGKKMNKWKEKEGEKRPK